MYALFNENTNYPMYARTTCRVASTQLSIRNRNSVHNHFNIVILLGHTAVKTGFYETFLSQAPEQTIVIIFHYVMTSGKNLTGQNKTIAI